MKLVDSAKIDLIMDDIFSAARLADGLFAQGRADLALAEINLIYAILSDAALVFTYPRTSAPSQSNVSKPLRIVDWIQSNASKSNKRELQREKKSMIKLETTEFDLRSYELRKKKDCSLIRRFCKRSSLMIYEFFTANHDRLT